MKQDEKTRKEGGKRDREKCWNGKGRGGKEGREGKAEECREWKSK